MKPQSVRSKSLEIMAEGSTNPVEDVEPPSPHKTTSLPMYDENRPSIQAAETGLVAVVDLGADGFDDGESQDAARPSDEVKSAPSAETQVREKMDKNPSVLIIEDTTELAEIIQATLERMNMVTDHATHGNRAIEKFNTMNPDVVLLDIGLPDMTGWKIMDAIKEGHQQTGRMPVIIIITAYDDPANRLVGKLQGVNGYLIKPFTADEIERAVSQAINSPTSG